MRYFANRLNGDGTETEVAYDLPFGNVTITDSLSAPDLIDATLDPELPEFRGVLVPWSTALYAEQDGVIRHGSIVTGLHTTNDGANLKVTSQGFANYPHGMPWTNSTLKYYQKDPAEVIRLIWERLQSHPRGNLGVTLSQDVTTPVRVGKKTATEDEPLLLANYATLNLGGLIDELLEAGSLDYREEHAWRSDGTISHFIRLAYPRMGVRRTDISFDIGVNCLVVPDVDIDADDYASEVLLLGAGEGDKMIRAHAYNQAATRLRRVHVRTAKHIGRLPTAQAAAQAQAKIMNTFASDVSTVNIVDHPNAPLFSWNVGDEVRLTGDAGWAGELDMWVRILATTYAPEANYAGASLTVARADRV